MSQFLPDLLLTLLLAIEASFTYPGILQQKEKLSDEELKDIIKQAASNRAAREVLGHNVKVWRSLAETLHSGNCVLREQANVRLQLLAKMRDLLILGRNLVARLPKSQDLAAYEGFEAELRVLMSLSVSKALAPISQDLADVQRQEALRIKDMHKKTITTCLQFLHNFIAGNETRKVHLFAQVFGPFPGDDNVTYSYTHPLTSSGPLPNASTESANGQDGSNSQRKSNVCQPFYSPGLLTKIPRILGPSEIEALPMILQSLVVPLQDSDIRMQNVRCNMLVALPGGQAVLQEMLVFLAQWDLDEHELTYRLMVQVVSAILSNGKIRELYRAFRSDKDIISPEQCVILKLLVSIWRPKQPDFDAQFKQLSVNSASDSPNDPWANIPPVDDSIAQFFCAEFSERVLPRVRQIILKQGEIISGQQKRDSFEWSVWDMDRAYEGLYQLMDVLVILTEEMNTTQTLLKQEPPLVGQLITLLADMERIFPRYIKAKEQHPPAPQKVSQDIASPPPPPPPPVSSTVVAPGGVGAVERPYDVVTEEDEIYDEEPAEDEEDDTVSAEPEEFTWPHIKRFIVILLSNLAWKNNDVKNMIREKGGLQLILNHCKIDDDNPYIREHAILCIRNLLEENPENQGIVRELEARQTVPSELLEAQGYESYIKDDGKVGVRKKGTGPTASSSG